MVYIQTIGQKGFFMTTGCTVLEVLKRLKNYANVFRYLKKKQTAQIHSNFNQK